MATWDEISKDPDVVKMSEGERADLKARYDASQKPATQEAPTTASKELPSWDTVTSDPDYQNAPEAEQEAIKARYQKAGGTAETAGTFKKGLQAIDAGLASFGSSLNTGEAGLSNLAGDKLNQLGLPTLGGMLKEHATTLENQNKSVYKRAIEEGKNTTAGRLAGEYGSTVGNIAATIAAPEVMIPAMAASSMGEAYEAQPEGQKSAAKAALVGASTYAANKVLPGAGGKLLNKFISEPVGKAASTLASKALGESTGNAVGSSIGRLTENTLLGGLGGAATGTAQAYSQGTSLAEGAKQGAKEGAIFGASLGTVAEVPGAVKGTVKGIRNIKTAQEARNNPEIPDTVKSLIDEQHTKISEAKTATEQKEALDTSPHYNAVRAAQINDHYGIPTLAQSMRGDKAGQEAFKFSEKQSDSDLSDVSNAQWMKRAGEGKKNTILSDVKKGAVKMDKEITDSIQSGKAAFSNIKSDVGRSFNAEEARGTETGKARKSVMSDIEPMSKAYASWGAAVKKGNRALAEKEALRFQDMYDNTAPMFKTEFSKTFKAPEGFTEGVNLVAHTREYFDARQQQLNLHPEMNKVNAERGDQLGRINIFNPAGIPLDVISTLPKAIASKVSRGKNVRQIEQSKAKTSSLTNEQQPATQAQVEQLSAMNHPEANTANLTRGQASKYLKEGLPEQQQPGAPSDIGAKVQNATLQREVELERAKVVDPELKKEITSKNVRDTELMKDIRKRDDIRNIQKVKKGAQYVEEARQNRLNVQHENATKELQRWHKEDASYLDYNKYVKPAIERLQQSTPEGNRIVSAQRVKQAAIRAYNAAEGKAVGTKASFSHAVNKMSVDVKQQAQPVIDKLFEGNKIPTDEQLKQGWKQIHELEANAHNQRGQTQAAQAAIKEGEAKAKQVDNNRMDIQTEQVEKSIRDSLEEAHNALPEEQKRMSKRAIEDFVSSKVNSTFKDNKPLTQAELDKAISSLKEEATKAANQHAKKSPVETEEELGADKELTDKARKQFEETGKLSEESKKNVENHMIHETEKAFNSGDVEKMKDSLDTVINHYFRSDSARVHTLTRFVDVLADAQKMKKQYPNNPEVWLTRTDVNSLGKAGNSHAGGMKGRLVDMITGENYADQKVVAKMLTNQKREAVLAKLNAKQPPKEGGLSQPKPGKKQKRAR